MDANDLTPFASIPWCRAILDDPTWTLWKSDSPRYEGHDPFWYELIRKPRGVRARCLLVGRPASETPQTDYVEMRQLLALGPALVGQKGICHGGFLATVMDEVGGILIQACELDRGLPPHTATLNMTYIKPVVTPGVILATSKVVERVRRKIRVLTTIVDADGVTCVSAEILFVTRKQNL